HVQLRERALRLAQLGAVVHALDRPDRVEKQLLAAGEVALRDGGAADPHRHAGLGRGVADLAVELAGGAERRLRLGVVAAPVLERRTRVPRLSAAEDAAALLGQLGGALDERLR